MKVHPPDPSHPLPRRAFWSNEPPLINIRTLLSLVCVVVATVAAHAAKPVEAPPKASDPSRIFKAGAATSDITPAIGAPTVGGWAPVPSTHVQDDLYLRCLALDDGATRRGFAVVHSVGVPREVIDVAKRLVQQETGVPSENLMMSATHTHSAPSARGANALVMGGPLEEYQKFLARRIADGVRRALNNL